MTGYVNEMFEKNLDFEGFALVCARAFGACIEMRDDPLDTTIPEEFKPSDYDTKELEKAKERLAKWETLSPEEKKDEIKLGLKTRIANYKRYIKESETKNKRLFEMIAKVDKWNPPSSEHVRFKEFMKEQLELCVDNCKYYLEGIEQCQNTDIDEEVINNLNDLKHDIERYEKSIKEEIDIASGKTNWVKQLREALK